MKKTKNKEKVSPPIDEEGYFCLQGDKLWKWRALDAEHRAAEVELETVKAQIQVEIARHPELSRLLDRQRDLFATLSASKTALLDVQKEVETIFGVSLKECAFDDRTGRLYHLTEAGDRGEPMKKTPERKRKKSHGTS